MKTPRASKVRIMLEARPIAKRRMIYLSTSDITTRTKYVIGKKFKTAGNLIPKGTTYYASFDEAYRAFSKLESDELAKVNDDSN